MKNERTAYDIPSDEMGADDKIVREQSYKGLSKEAKEVIKIILTSPAEILSMLPKNRSRSNKLTKSKIRLYLTLKWNHPKLNPLIIKNLASAVTDEISNWVKKNL